MGQGWEEKKMNTDRKEDERDAGVCVDLEYRMKYSSLNLAFAYSGAETQCGVFSCYNGVRIGV